MIQPYTRSIGRCDVQQSWLLSLTYGSSKTDASGREVTRPANPKCQCLTTQEESRLHPNLKNMAFQSNRRQISSAERSTSFYDKVTDEPSADESLHWKIRDRIWHSNASAWAWCSSLWEWNYTGAIDYLVGVLTTIFCFIKNNIIISLYSCTVLFITDLKPQTQSAKKNKNKLWERTKQRKGFLAGPVYLMAQLSSSNYFLNVYTWSLYACAGIAAEANDVLQSLFK